MKHRLRFTVITDSWGTRGACTFAEYSEADFTAMFSAQDRAMLAIGGTVFAPADKTSAWPMDVAIEEPACQHKRVAQ